MGPWWLMVDAHEWETVNQQQEIQWRRTTKDPRSYQKNLSLMKLNFNDVVYFIVPTVALNPLVNIPLLCVYSFYISASSKKTKNRRQHT
mmetsp:Transcript_27498/g.38216  ORF Transcript_27498/g.38216 Transcript_27498/m.38216 type:complete len:89 (+) Transcript_27498:34-300(+)